MKKTLVFLFSVLLLLGLFVSCENNIDANKSLVNVKLGASEGKGLSASVEYASLDSLDWYYKADAASDVFNYGETSAWTKLEAGLDDSIELSQGIWSFELKAVEKGADVNTEAAVYLGSLKGAHIEAQPNDRVLSITIPVTAQMSGDGYIAFGNITITLRDGTTATVAPNKAQIDSDEYDLPREESVRLSTGDHVVKVWYVDSSDKMVKAEEAVKVTVFGGATTVIKGFLSEITQDVEIGGENTGSYGNVDPIISEIVIENKPVVKDNVEVAGVVETTKEAAVSNGALTVKFPVGTKLDVIGEDAAGKVMTGIVEADKTEEDVANISIASFDNVKVFDLTLSVSQDNTTLVEVAYNVGAGLDITQVIHVTDEGENTLSSTASDTEEWYSYNPASGVLTLHIFHASYITISEGDGYHASSIENFMKAIEMADENTPVVLSSDLELSEPIEIPAEKKVVLDLNGYTLSSSSSESKAYNMIANNGDLTIIDSSLSKSGKITYAYHGTPDASYGYQVATIDNRGSLVIDGATIENTTAAMSQASYAINTGAGANLTIESGKVLNLNGHAIRQVSFGTAPNNVTVNGGYIEGTRAIQMQLPGSSSSTTKPEMKLAVNGGELRSNEDVYNLAIYLFSNGQSAENVSLELKDGIFNGNVAINAAAADSMKSGAVAVSGGTYNGTYGIFTYSENPEAQKIIKINKATYNVGSFDSLWDELSAYVDSDSEVLINITNDIAFETEVEFVISKGNITIDLCGNTLSSVSESTGKNYNFIDVKGSAVLTVKNGTITTEHKGENMAWSKSTNVFNVTAGGVLNIEDAIVKNLGGSDMAFVVHLNNWGEVTLNASKTVFESTYVGIRAFNSGYDMNNISLSKCDILTGNGCIWVHNYTAADFGNSQEKADAAANRLNFNFEDVSIARTNGSKSLVRFGFTNSIYYSDIEMTNVVAGTEVALAWALENGKNVTFNNDIATSETLLIDSSVKIDGSGYTLTTPATRAFRITKSDIEVEINNLGISSTAEQVGTNDIRGISFDPNINNVSLALNDVSISFEPEHGDDWAYAVNLCGESTGHTLTIKGGEYNGANVINVWGDNHTISIEDAVLESLYNDNETFCGACIRLEGKGCDVTATNVSFKGNNAVACDESEKDANTVELIACTDNTKTYSAE